LQTLAHLIDFAPLTAGGFLGGKKSIKNSKFEALNRILLR